VLQSLPHAVVFGHGGTDVHTRFFYAVAVRGGCVEIAGCVGGTRFCNVHMVEQEAFVNTIECMF
jgi:hypothetical protein